MAAYAVFIRENTRDNQELDTYAPLAAASMSGRSIKVLAAYGRQEVLEGSSIEGAVIVEFPSMEEAKAWYESPDYREAREHRFRGADYRAFLIEGVEQSVGRSLPSVVAAYVSAVNNHDAAAFLALFADDAVVEDVGRIFRGIDEIKNWSAKEIFAANVTLDVLAALVRDDETILTTKVDGTFDRTGRPDPLFLEHTITVKDEKITRLACGLAKAPALAK